MKGGARPHPWPDRAARIHISSVSFAPASGNLAFAARHHGRPVWPSRPRWPWRHCAPPLLAACRMQQLRLRSVTTLLPKTDNRPVGDRKRRNGYQAWLQSFPRCLLWAWPHHSTRWLKFSPPRRPLGGKPKRIGGDDARSAVRNFHRRQAALAPRTQRGRHRGRGVSQAQVPELRYRGKGLTAVAYKANTGPR